MKKMDVKNADTETTCLDYLLEYGIRGREEDLIREYYKRQGIKESQIGSGLELLSKADGDVIKKQSNCKHYTAVSASIFVHYACMNENCKCFGMYPPLCSKDCEGYEKD